MPFRQLKSFLKILIGVQYYGEFLNAGVFVALIRQGCAVPPIHYCAIATGNC